MWHHKGCAGGGGMGGEWHNVIYGWTIIISQFIYLYGDNELQQILLFFFYGGGGHWAAWLKMGKSLNNCLCNVWNISVKRSNIKVTHQSSAWGGGDTDDING